MASVGSAVRRAAAAGDASRLAGIDSPMTNIRPAADADLAEVLRVHESAFGHVQGVEIAELVVGLLSDKSAVPLFSFVAEMEGRSVGHILFTAVQIQGASCPVSAQILAPLGVAKSHQGKGVGRLLVIEGLGRLGAAGVDLVFVLGHPGLYRKYGFRRASLFDLKAPYPIPPEHEGAWMVQELRPNILGRVRGTVRCAKTLGQPRHWVE